MERISFAKLAKELTTNSKIIFLESVVFFLLLWHISATLFNVTEFFGTPMLILTEMYNMLFVTERAWPHVLASSRRIMLAFVFSLLIGTTVGIIMGMTNILRQYLTVYATFLMAVPGLIAAVFAAIWFGFSDLSPMVATAILTTPLISVTIRENIDDLDANLIEMSGSFNVSRRRVIYRVVIQSIAPAIFGTARYAFSLAWKITNLTEVIIADVGIGYMIRLHFEQLNTIGVIKYVLFFSILVLMVEFGIIRQIEKRVFDYREEVSVGIGA